MVPRNQTSSSPRPVLETLSSKNRTGCIGHMGNMHECALNIVHVPKAMLLSQNAPNFLFLVSSWPLRQIWSLSRYSSVIVSCQWHSLCASHFLKNSSLFREQAIIYSCLWILLVFFCTWSVVKSYESKLYESLMHASISSREERVKDDLEISRFTRVLLYAPHLKYTNIR